MKKIISLTTITFLLATFFIACKKDDTSSSTTLQTSALVTQGIWRITYYNDSGIDETSNFTGYTFTFTSGGSVTAISGSIATNGTWNSYNDDSQNKLYLEIGSTPPLDELKGDWHITEKTSVKIKLEDVSGGGSGTDYLTFEKL
ncbi:hypothetical protein [Ferruginibacter sp.]|nr:hypothetical protein [Ferruginibacter sp.]